MSEEKEIKEFAKVLIPMVRQVIPNLIAAQITGVQPMQPMSDIKEPFQQGTVESASGLITWHWVQLPYISNIGQVFALKYNAALQNMQETTQDEVGNWLTEMFGPASVDRWYKADRKYYFRDTEDVAVFLLRWRS